MKRWRILETERKKQIKNVEIKNAITKSKIWIHGEQKVIKVEKKLLANLNISSQCIERNHLIIILKYR